MTTPTRSRTSDRQAAFSQRDEMKERPSGRSFFVLPSRSGRRRTAPPPTKGWIKPRHRSPGKRSAPGGFCPQPTSPTVTRVPGALRLPGLRQCRGHRRQRSAHGSCHDPIQSRARVDTQSRMTHEIFSDPGSPGKRSAPGAFARHRQHLPSLDSRVRCAYPGYGGGGTPSATKRARELSRPHPKPSSRRYAKPDDARNIFRSR